MTADNTIRVIVSYEHLILYSFCQCKLWIETLLIEIVAIFQNGYYRFCRFGVFFPVRIPYQPASNAPITNLNNPNFLLSRHFLSDSLFTENTNSIIIHCRSQ